MSNKESLESILGELGKAINQRASQIKPMMEEIEKYNSDFDKKMESCKSALYDIYKGIFESVGNVFSKFIGLPYTDDFKGKTKYRNIKEKGKDGKTIEKKIIKEIILGTGYPTEVFSFGEDGELFNYLLLYPFSKLGLIWVDNNFVISSEKTYFKGRCGLKHSFDWFFNKKICKFFNKHCRDKYLKVDYLTRPIEALSYNASAKYGFGKKLVDYIVDFKDSEEYKRLEREREEHKNKVEKLDGIMNKFADKINEFKSGITDFEKTFSKKNQRNLKEAG